MRLLAAFLLCSGCAVGRIQADGTLVGAALGHAKLERCEYPALRYDDVAAMCVNTGEACSIIKGGPLSLGAAEMIGNALGGLMAWLMP